MIEEQECLEALKEPSLCNPVLKYKMKRMGKFWLKCAKKSRERKCRLFEWRNTEQEYIEKLFKLKDQVEKPLIENKLIEIGEEAQLFPNLEGMIAYGKIMKDTINCLLENWNPISTVLSKTVEKLWAHLKIYKEYTSNYMKASSRIEEIKKDPKYREIITIENYLVEDYRIKPIQRPLQYNLFLTEYLKNLPKEHIDRKDLEKAKEKLKIIAEEINGHVEKKVRSEKLIQLEQIYGNIAESSREFQFEFEAAYPDFDCRVYVFNDLLLIVKIIGGNREEMYCYMKLCGGSYVIRQRDGKYFKNRIYICGSDESIHLTFKESERANEVYSKLERIIEEVYKKECCRAERLEEVRVRRETMVMNRHEIENDYKWKEQYEYKMKLRIEVIGIEKRLYEKEWKFVFAVKIRLAKPNEIYQIAFYEIEELKELEKYIKEIYPNLKVPSLDTKFKGMLYEDYKNDFTKYYEFRAILIEKFFNFCFRSKEICQKPEYVVFKLRLHESLWDFLNKFSSSCICEACLNSENVQDMVSYEKQKKKIREKEFQFCILNSFSCQNMLSEKLTPNDFKNMNLEQKIVWAICKEHRIDYGLQNQAHFTKKLCFHVRLTLIGEESELFIKNATINDTCAEIVEEVLLNFGVRESSDFSLVYVHGNHHYPLDRDEYILDVIKHLEKDYQKIESNKKSANVGNRNSLLNAFSKNFDNFGDLMNDCSIQDDPKLYVRKMIFLSPDLEEKSCENNPERYRLIIGEMLRRFQEQTFILGLEEMKLFCALMYGIEEFTMILFSDNIFCNEEKIKRYLPESKWSFVSIDFIKNVQQLLEKHVKPLKNISQLYEFTFKQFSEKSGWMIQYFQVQCENPEILEESKDKSLLIGINSNKVVICRKFNSDSLFEYPIGTFNYRISGDCLFITNGEEEILLCGNCWVLFSYLVELYKKLWLMEIEITK